MIFTSCMKLEGWWCGEETETNAYAKYLKTTIDYITICMQPQL